MYLMFLLLASVSYAAGGVFMKFSDGATRVGSTLAFLALFGVGALLQAIGMKHSQMGVSYVLVLGAEAVVAVLLSIMFLRETYSVSRVAAIVLVLIGIVWLRAT